MTCGGSHLGFPIGIKNIKFVEHLPMIIPGQFGFNCPSGFREDCRKASQQLSVLKRIGCFLSKLKKLTIFHSFILSNFNFCPFAWHFCSKANTIKLEKIQERALRFIYEDYNSTYEELLHIANVFKLVKIGNFSKIIR
jgi:hypothetical protein